MTKFLSGSPTPTIYVLHENDEWVAPLRSEFEQRGTPFQEWHLKDGIVDLSSEPPPGVFYNRMSASSHTRGHRYAPELTAATLAWLARHGRETVNGAGALTLELSKVAQYEALKAYGITVPDTLAVVGREGIAKAVERLGFPLILKHNRAGKGLGVILLQSMAELTAHVESDAFEVSIDGVTLVQRYIAAPEPYITRVEFVGGKFLYAVRVDTSDGFELCPADVCAIEEQPAHAPTDKFTIIEGFDHPWIPAWERFLSDNGIQIAGIEFIVNANGQSFAYDVNTNTNYNLDAEAKSKSSVRGMVAIADHLTQRLAAAYPDAQLIEAA